MAITEYAGKVLNTEQNYAIIIKIPHVLPAWGYL